MALTPIQEFYSGKNVFVTGASGFVGKILLEKLFHSCSRLNKIYLLMRPKLNASVLERRESLFASPLFKLRTFDEKWYQKIVVIPGDLTQPKLGLSPENYRMLVDEIDIIFHLGAVKSYNVKLDTAILTNINGTREILVLARQMKHLECAVCLSDIYTSCKQSVIGEEFYKSEIRADNLEQMVNSVPKEICLEVAPYMTEHWPNTYTFSKSVTENCIQQHGSGLPICIIRASMITFTLQEPQPGWLDDVNGFNMYPYELLRGSLRVTYGNLTSKINLVPADFVVNLLLTAAWNQTTQPNPNQTKIYNYTSQERNPIDGETFWKMVMLTARKVPSANAKFYYFHVIASNALQFYVYAFFLHLLPALVGDLALLMTGKKTKFLKFYQNLNQHLVGIGYFFHSTWKFNDDNVYELYEKMMPNDKAIFNFNIRTLEWSKYLTNGFRGIREHLLGESATTIPQAVQRLRKLKLAYNLMSFGLYALSTWIFYKFASSILTKIVR